MLTATKSAVNIYLVCVPYSCYPTSFTHLVYAGYLNDRWHERASNATMASKTILSSRASAMIPLRGGPRSDPLLFVATGMHHRSNQRFDLSSKIVWLYLKCEIWIAILELNFFARWRKCHWNIVKRSSIDNARLCYNVLPDHSDPAKSCKLFCKISQTTAFYHYILIYGISRYVTLRKQVVTLWGYVINVHIYRIITSFASADTRILFVR